MKTFWSFLFLLAFTFVSEAASPFHLGSLTINNGLTWKDTNAIPCKEYKIYLAETNSEAFMPIATVTTNYWPGYASTNINGYKRVFVTGINSSNLESEPSEKVIVGFESGIPKPVSDIQIYSVIRAAATNAAALMPVTLPPRDPGMPEPNPPVVERFRGPEWQPSRYQK